MAQRLPDGYCLVCTAPISINFGFDKMLEKIVDDGQQQK
jgi:hypothetical protein